MTSAVALKNIPQALKDWSPRSGGSAPRGKKMLRVEENNSGSGRES